MNIFELSKSHEDLIKEVEENEGLLTPELEAALEVNKNNFMLKGESYGKIFMLYRLTIDSIDLEIKRLKKRKDQKLKALNFFETQIDKIIELFGRERFKSLAEKKPKEIEYDTFTLVNEYNKAVERTNLEPYIQKGFHEVPQVLHKVVKVSFKQSFTVDEMAVIYDGLLKLGLEPKYTFDFDYSLIEAILILDKQVKSEGIESLNPEEKKFYDKYQDVLEYVSFTFNTKTKVK